MQSNLRVIGESTLTDGIYNNINIVGICNIYGSIESNRTKVIGELKIKKNLNSKFIKIIGTLDVDENCKIDEANILGSVKVKQNFNCNILNLNGVLSINNDCNAENAIIHGVIEIKGLFNVDSIEFKSKCESTINEIGGKKLTVKKPITGIFNDKVILNAKTIEFDEIDIDFVKADVIRGKSINIGSHCEINKIEYSNSLNVKDGAKILEKYKF